MSEKKELQPLLTDQELADRWGIGTRALWTWRNEGKAPPHIMIGKRRRYRLSDIEAYENERLQEPGGE